MPIQISLLTESDIPGAITAIQEAFADDPYNLWVYNDRSKVRSISILHLTHHPLCFPDLACHPIKAHASQAEKEGMEKDISWRSVSTILT